MHFRNETKDDWWDVEALYDLCFAPGREALSSYRLRDGVDPVRDLSILALDDEGSVSGAIRYWPVKVGGYDVLLLGPIAVHPIHQGEGLGAALIRNSISIAKAMGWERVLLVGDAPYYARFGFSKVAGVEMPPPTNPDRILGLDLHTGAWHNVRGKVERFA